MNRIIGRKIEMLLLQSVASIITLGVLGFIKWLIIYKRQFWSSLILVIAFAVVSGVFAGIAISATGAFLSNIWSFIFMETILAGISDIFSSGFFGTMEFEFDRKFIFSFIIMYVATNIAAYFIVVPR